MTRFEETVAKIAASPAKHAAFKRIPRTLFKHAGFMDQVKNVGQNLGQGVKNFGKNLGEGLDAIAPPGSIRQQGLAAGVLGAGAWGAGKALDQFDQSSDRLDAERKQMGQLTGEHKFRMTELDKLSPMHRKVFQSISQSPDFAQVPPEKLQSHYETMRRFAPILASDPNAVHSFLLETSTYGGGKGPNYATLKNLADTEQSIARAGGIGLR